MEAKQFEPLQIEYPVGACTPQQLGQSCLETAEYNLFCFTCNHSVAFSFWVSTCQWLLLSLVVSDMVLWFPKLGDLTTVGDGAKDVLKEISPHKSSWEEKLLDVHKLQATVYDLEPFGAINRQSTVHVASRCMVIDGPLESAVSITASQCG